MLPLLIAGPHLIAAVAQPVVTGGPQDQFWFALGHMVLTGLLGTTLGVAAVWAIRQARN